MSDRDLSERRSAPRGGLLDSTFTFLRVRGIPIGAHWTWLLIAALVTWSLGARLFPSAYPDLSSTAHWVMAAVAAVAFFASVLAHELGHALTAVARGSRLEGITLWLFGGVAKIRGGFGTANTELLTAIAGPAVSVVLVLLFGAAGWVSSAAGWPAPVQGVLDYLARINLLVLGFNMVPALPLDGGRVLRAWLWRRQDDFVSATYTAARAGRAFGMLLIGIGLLGLLTGADSGGLWIALIGWFPLQAAGAEAGQASVRSAFAGLRVRDVMSPEPRVLAPDVTVSELLDRAATPGEPSSYPVVDDGALVGFVSYRQAGGVARNRRSRTSVGAVMIPAEEVSTVGPNDPVADAIEALQEGPGRAVVVDDGRVVGVLTLGDVARTLEIRELRGDVAAPSVRRAGFLVTAGIGLILVVAASLLYHPPLYVLAPGPAVDAAAGIRISGVPTDPIDGKYVLATVALERPTAFGAMVALFDDDKEVVSESSLFPEGVDEREYLQEQQQVFEESRQIAAAAAADAVGLEVGLRGTGAIVLETVPGSPAAGVLRRGDVIVRIGDRRVRLSADLTEEIKAHPAGTAFRLTFERGGSRRTATVRSTRLDDIPDVGVVIGVRLQTRDFDVDLPFEIEFPESDIGGPSAGLAYALAIADLLDPGDFAAGRTIAATGTIGFTGEVGEVGGIQQKAAGVEAAGADVFVVPSGEEAGVEGDGLVVRAVRSLRQALRALRASA